MKINAMVMIVNIIIYIIFLISSFPHFLFLISSFPHFLFLISSFPIPCFITTRCKQRSEVVMLRSRAKRELNRLYAADVQKLSWDRRFVLGLLRKGSTGSGLELRLLLYVHV